MNTNPTPQHSADCTDQSTVWVTDSGRTFRCESCQTTSPTGHTAAPVWADNQTR